ncbi:hypothetical protein ALC62_06914 [Cyphomyrmex costatus]|uniref:CCHC-type domain-containing protein n=1 Tax=Cyphomyrmex costatus TaxID=456900 RepID=A0A151II89_9HYME|nr:hypothetical protein ALC62_06914 [Cyphomyrmex costatus]
MPQRMANVITIRDIEGSVSHFSGDDKTKVERWLDEFEDMCGLLHAEVHAQLIKRKRLPNETPRQYMYAMQTIADQGDVEEEALIQYIIDGVPDEENNKSILYGADTLPQLRKSLEHFDRMKEKADKKSRKEQPKIAKGKNADKSEKKASQKERKETRCFSCGSIEHVARDCPHKDEGPKCFKCNQFGHIATKCDSSDEATKKDRKVNVISVSERAPTDDEITVVINDMPIISMMDTGTHCTLLKYSEYQRIGSPPINAISHSLYGLRRSQVTPIGIFQANLMIQGDRYQTEIHVVPDKAMDERMLLGKGLTRQMDIRMRGGMLSIKKLDTKEERKENEDSNKGEKNRKNNEDIGQEMEKENSKDDSIKEEEKEDENNADSGEEKERENNGENSEDDNREESKIEKDRKKKEDRSRDHGTKLQ